MNSWPPSAGRTSEATTKVFDFIRDSLIGSSLIVIDKNSAKAQVALAQAR